MHLLMYVFVCIYEYMYDFYKKNLQTDWVDMSKYV